jgi:hypothetical protein
MLEFLDPHAEPSAEAHSYSLGLGDALEGRPVCIGLLANGFADSETFVAAVGRALGRRLPNAEFVHAAKPNPSLLVADDEFDRLRAQCDAVVGAYGH